MPFAEVNGVQIYYKLTGEGPHVLQVPGAVSGHEGYGAVTPGMAEHFTTIDYDPRGYGQSDRPKQKYTFDVWANDMVGLLDALGIERSHVHGGSMGSTLAVYYAARYPDRVGGMVVSGCTAKSDYMAVAMYEVWKALARGYGTDSRELAFELCTKAVRRALFDGPDGRETLVAAVQDLATRFVSVDVFCDACDALIEVDVTDELANVRAPTLVIVGDEDVLTPEHPGPSGAGAAYIYEHLTNVPFKEYLFLEGSAHANLMDSPDACLAAIIPFLQRVDAQ
jgi:3-oxoadipate enol-lactonase